MQYVVTSANGKKVYVDAENSHAAIHLSDTPTLFELVKELLQSIELEGENVYLDKDMGRTVGTTDLIKTGPDDEILYAKRVNRTNYTRFVKGHSAQPSSFVTVVLVKRDKKSYELWSAWIGRAVPQFPGDKHETTEGRLFWRNHALVWGNQEVRPGTEVQEWPW
jgi:hypothetical protein